jgi:hypothetical protein
MSPKQSTVRLLCYVSLSMLAAVTGGIMAVNFSDWREVVLFGCGIAGAGITALRSYIDQSPTQITKPDEPR